MSSASSKYGPEVFEAILLRIAEGESLTAVCNEPGQPSKSTVHALVKNNHDFAKGYEAAVKARAQSRVDELMRINAKLEEGAIDPSSARVLCDNLKWLAAREDPQKFSDRLWAELTGKDGKDLIPEKKMDDLEMARWIAHLLRQGELQAGKLKVIESKTDG